MQGGVNPLINGRAERSSTYEALAMKARAAREGRAVPGRASSEMWPVP